MRGEGWGRRGGGMREGKDGVLQDLLGENNPWASSDGPAVSQPRLSSVQHVVTQYAEIAVCSDSSM